MWELHSFTGSSEPLDQVMPWKINLKSISYFSLSRNFGFSYFQSGLGWIQNNFVSYCSQLKVSKVGYVQPGLVFTADPPNQCHCLTSRCGGGEVFEPWHSTGAIHSALSTRISPLCDLKSSETPSSWEILQRRGVFREVKQSVKQQCCPFCPGVSYFYPNTGYICYIWTLESSSGPKKALERSFVYLVIQLRILLSI